MMVLFADRLSQARREDGVVAILSVLFIMTIGMLSLFIMWGLGYTSGAYTTLYGAAQAAAYAGAAEIDFGAVGATAKQPPFLCGGPTFDAASGNGGGLNPVCSYDGPASSSSSINLTADTAVDLLQNELTGANNPYKLKYQPGGCSDCNVHLVDANGNQVDGVLAYEIPLAPGAAADIDPNCGTGNGGTVAATQIDPTSDPSLIYRSCWSLRPLTNGNGDFGAADYNYSSGVVVIATADIPFVPGCKWATVCPIEHLRVVVPARVGQQQSGYGKGINTP